MESYSAGYMICNDSYCQNWPTKAYICCICYDKLNVTNLQNFQDYRYFVILKLI